jgi:flagellar FliL protein
MQMKPPVAAALALPGEAAPKKRGKKKLLLAAPALLVAVAAGLYFSGMLPGVPGSAPKTVDAAALPPSFIDLPEIVANLNGNPRKPSYLKLRAKLEVARPEDAAAVALMMPRVLDLFQTYLRETRPEELRGSAGIYRLREELIARSGIAVAPARVQDVLFTEVLVQ